MWCVWCEGIVRGTDGEKNPRPLEKMRAFELAMQLTKYAGSSSDSLPNDAELYEMEEGVTEVHITPILRQETEKRYRMWAAARDRATDAHELLTEAIPEQHENDAAWRQAVEEFHSKYRAHRRVCATHLPLSLRFFGRRGNDVTAEQYRQLLLARDPVGAVAAAFSMSRHEVESTKIEREYLEWTFLDRYISQYAEVVSRGESCAQACLELTVQLVDALIGGTYRDTFSKTKVRSDGSDMHTFTLFYVEIDELEALIRHLRHAPTEPRKVLMAFELIWHVSIPDSHREWLRVDPTESIVQLLTPAPTAAPPTTPASPAAPSSTRLSRPPPPKRPRTSVG